MCLIRNDKRMQVCSALVFLPRIDNFLFDKPEHEQHLGVRHDVVLVCEQTLKIEVYKVCVRTQSGRRVPDIRISARNKLLQVQFRRAHIAQCQTIHTSLVLGLQCFKQIGKEREVVGRERRTVRTLRDTHSFIGFHDKVIDEFNDIDGRVCKHDFEKALQHF